MTTSFRRLSRILWCWILLTLLSLSLSARPADPNDFFETRIRPLLSDHCLACHGEQMQIGGLNLSTEKGLLKGSEKGPVVVKGDPDNSRLIQAVRYVKDIKMPPTAKLSSQQIADLTEWV